MGQLAESEEKARRQKRELGNQPNRSQVPSKPQTLVTTKEVKEGDFTLAGCTSHRPPGKRVCILRMLKRPHTQ